MDAIDHSSRLSIACINLGSLLAQIVQIAGYPTLLALLLTRSNYPAWVIGIILSFQWCVVLFCAPLVPGLMKQLGTKTTCQVGTIISLASLAILLISNSTAAIIFSALLMGGGLTVRWVGCDTWLVEAVQERLRGRAIGIHETLMGFGVAIGPLLTMLCNEGRNIAIVVYMLLLIISFTCFAFGSRVTAVPDAFSPEARALKITIVFRLLMLALIAALAAGYIETAMVALLPLYLMKFYYSEVQALAMLSAFGLGGTILQAPLGWVADRWSFRVGQILCLSLIILGGLFLPAMINFPSITVFILFIWGGCVGGLNTLAVIEAGLTLKPAMSGTGMALIASSYTLGGAGGPAVSGAALNLWHGHGIIFSIVAIMAVYASILAYSRRLENRQK